MVLFNKLLCCVLFIFGLQVNLVNAESLSKSEFISQTFQCSLIEAAIQLQSKEHQSRLHCMDSANQIFELVDLPGDFTSEFERKSKLAKERYQQALEKAKPYHLTSGSVDTNNRVDTNNQEQAQREISNANYLWRLVKESIRPQLSVSHFYRSHAQIILSKDSLWKIELQPAKFEKAIDNALKADHKLTQLMGAESDAQKPSERALMTGQATVLVVHVTAPDSTTSATPSELSDSVFGTLGDSVNLASQYADCSYNKKTFVPATGANITDGVVQLTISTNVNGATDGTIRNAVTDAGNALFGSLQAQADHVMYALPPGTDGSWIAYAYVDHWLSVYNNNWATYVSGQMHEVGHNLDMAHSNEGATEYGDQSGMMGYSYSSDDSPKMCFNAGKSSKFGWYGDKELSLNNESWSGKLIGLADYANATNEHYVLLKIRSVDGNDSAKTLNLTYNRKKGVNSGTVEGGGKVLVVENETPTGYNTTNLLAKLSSGESYTFADYWGAGKDFKITLDSVGLDANDVEYAMVSVDNGNAVVQYQLTVNNGSGSGAYSVGESASIAADSPPSGQAFSAWEIQAGSPTITSINSANTTLIMGGEDATVNATFHNVYPLVVNQGSGDGDYAENSQVSIVADAAPSLQEFDQWIIEQGSATIASPTSASTSLTMPAQAVTVAASYRNMPVLTVNNGTGSGSYASGSVVSIQANAAPNLQEFDHWEIETGSITISSITNASTSVTLGSNDAVITAIYRNLPALTVNNGTGSGSYPASTQVSISAQTASSNQEFVEWVIESGSAAIADANNPNTTLTTGTVDTTVTAVFQNVYSITVNAGSGSGSYPEGSQIDIVANTPANDQEFASWTINSGNAVIASASNASTQLTVGNLDSVVTATYRNIYPLTVNNGSGDGSYAAGTSVSISANPAASGQEFAYWEVNAGSATISSTTSANTSLITSDQATTVTAIYRNVYPLTVENGLGDGIYAAGIDVTILADDAPSGQEFDRWVISSGAGSIAAEADSETTFTTAAVNTIVTATYRDVYQLEVNDGSGQGLYAAGVEVTIIANDAPSDQEFDRWQINAGDVTIESMTSAETSLIMGAEDASVSATYRALLLLTVNSGNGGGLYSQNSQVTISADAAPSGQAFDRWVINSGEATVANPASSTTTVTLAADDVSISASYLEVAENISEEESGGSGSSSILLLCLMLTCLRHRSVSFR